MPTHAHSMPSYPATHLPPKHPYTHDDAQVVNLPELYKASNNACCVSRGVLGDYTPLVRMDGSGGKFYATADPDCKQPIEAAAYPTTYQAIWMCGKCEGGKCTQADGGAVASQRGGAGKFCQATAICTCDMCMRA